MRRTAGIAGTWSEQIIDALDGLTGRNIDDTSDTSGQKSSGVARQSKVGEDQGHVVNDWLG
jgi:hypothetical protein